MKRFAIKFAFFVITLWTLLKLMDLYYTAYASSHKNVCDKPEWILNHKGQNIDFAFIGNSRVENMVDINYIETVTKKRGINLGLIGANYAENYLLLDQFLKAGNKIKNLIIQVDMHSLNSNKELNYPFHDYKYMYLLNDSTVQSVYKDNTPGHKLLMWTCLPFVRYMEYGNRYVLYKMLKGGYECNKSPEFDSTKGSVLFTPDKFPDWQYRYSYWKINENDQKYLGKLITFSKQNYINVILYTAPIYSRYLSYQLKYNDIMESIKQQTSKEGIAFFNFSGPKDSLCTHREYFNDNIHMNIIGVDKFSVKLADSIQPLLK